MIAELIAKMKTRRASVEADAWSNYRTLLRKAVDAKLTDKETANLEAAVEELKRTPEEVEEDAQIMARHTMYAARVAGLASAEEEHEKLEAIRAELNAEARAFDEKQAPRWEQFHAAREQVEAKIAELRGAQSNLRGTEESAPHLFPANT